MTRNDTHTPSDQDFLPPNPLTTLRTLRNLSQAELAVQLKLSKTTVQFAEQGCFAYPPLPYRPLLTPAQALAYQQFKTAKRLYYFHAHPDSTYTCSIKGCRGLNFDPRNWANLESFDELLDFLEVTPFQFASLICVTPAEVFRFAKETKLRRRRLPSNVTEALRQVNCPPSFYGRLFISGELTETQLTGLTS